MQFSPSCLFGVLSPLRVLKKLSRSTSLYSSGYDLCFTSIGFSRNISIKSKLSEYHLNWKLKSIEKDFDVEHNCSSHTDHIRRHEAIYTAQQTLSKNGVSKDSKMINALGVSLFDLGEQNSEYKKMSDVRSAVNDLFFDPGRVSGVRVFNSFFEKDITNPAPVECEKEVASTEQYLLSNNNQRQQLKPLWSPLNMQAHQTLEEPSMKAIQSRPTVEALYSDEWRRLQESRLRKVLEQRKLQWLKTQHLPNPTKTAKFLVKSAFKLKEQEDVFKTGELFPALFQTVDLTLDPIEARKVEELTQRSNLVTNMLQQLREKKKLLSKAANVKAPKVNGQTMDRYEQHQQLRSIRLAYQIKGYLDHILTANSSKVFHGMLKGLRITITGVTRKSPTSASKIYYEILSKHSVVFAQQRLECTIPYLRYQVTSLFDLPRAPLLQFIHDNPNNENPFEHEKLAKSISEIDMTKMEYPTKGIMEGAYFVSKRDLLDWIRNDFGINIAKIEDCGSGIVYLKIMDRLYPGKVPIRKMKSNVKQEWECLHNLKILQTVFSDCGIRKHIDIDRLAKCMYLDNLEFLQWLKCFYDRFPGESVTDEMSLSAARSMRPLLAQASGSSRSVSSMRRASTASNTRLTSGDPKMKHETNFRPTSSITARPLVSPPRVGSASRSIIKKEDEIAKLREAFEEQKREVNIIKEELENADKESQFYFGKLRKLEVMSNESNRTTFTVQEVQEILFAEEDIPVTVDMTPNEGETAEVTDM